MIHVGRAFIFLSLALAASGCDRPSEVVHEAEPAPADAPPALTLAHEAYLTGDFVAMGERLRDTIVDPRAGELAVDNAFALLESAYDATRGHLPARAPLPSVVSEMSLGVLNGANAWGAHRLIFLDLKLTEGRAAHLADLRVTRLPSEPVLGLVEKRGALRVTHEAKGFDHVKLEARDLDALPDRGAFAIHVDFDDAPSIDTWVLANKLVASAQPELTSPATGEALADPRPDVAWRPFHSPELAPWEPRSVYVSITRDAASDPAWSLYRWEPGDLARARVDDPLEDGAYWLDLLYLEHRTFGGVTLSRAAETGRPFTVAR